MCGRCQKIIDLDQVKGEAIKKRDFYQGVIDCEHEWEEDLKGRLPHPFIDEIMLAYKCVRCGYVAKIMVTWEEYERGIDIS